MSEYASGYRPPRSGGMPAWGWVLIVVGALFLVCTLVMIPAAVLFPVFSQARAKAQQASCMSNLKQLSMGVMLYTQDYDMRNPPASTWSDRVIVYTGRNRLLLHCPSTPPDNPCGYAYNSRQSGVRLQDIKYPAETPMIYDSSAGKWNAADPVSSFAPRHRSLGNVGFSDTHVKAFSTAPPPVPGRPARAAPGRFGGGYGK
jgi:hypothetical protein